MLIDTELGCTFSTYYVLVLVGGAAVVWLAFAVASADVAASVLLSSATRLLPFASRGACQSIVAWWMLTAAWACLGWFQSGRGLRWLPMTLKVSRLMDYNSSKETVRRSCDSTDLHWFTSVYNILAGFIHHQWFRNSSSSACKRPGSGVGTLTVPGRRVPNLTFSSSPFLILDCIRADCWVWEVRRNLFPGHLMCFFKCGACRGFGTWRKGLLDFIDPRSFLLKFFLMREVERYDDSYLHNFCLGAQPVKKPHFSLLSQSVYIA